MSPSSPHIVLLYGDDPFRIKEKLDAWKIAFIQKYGGDINLDEIDGETPIDNILRATEAMPFLGEKRLVIVKNLFQGQDKEALKEFAENIEKTPETCTLILVEEKAPDERTALFKKLQKIARLEDCKPLTGALLTEWIQKKAIENGSRIEIQDALYLGQITEGDMFTLHNEIQKLASYCYSPLTEQSGVSSPASFSESGVSFPPYPSPNPITRAAIDELVQGSLSPSIFRLTDSLGQKRAKDAIETFHQLIKRGEEIPGIFGMLVRQIRLILQILDAQKTTKSASGIAAKLKQNPYAVSQILPACRNFNEAELKTIYSKLLKIDRDLKTGEIRWSTNDQTEYLLAIEQFIIEVCSHEA